jgi:Protein of unknown function (DUF2505)
LRFELFHEFDIALDALELAVLSPDFLEKLVGRLHNIERATQLNHALTPTVLERTWFFQWNIPIPTFATSHVTREMCAWEEHTTYQLSTHTSTWKVHPRIKPEWQKFFSAAGDYRLEAAGGNQTIRRVTGEILLNVPLVKQVAERFVISEIRKNFDAEAATLREFATLA